MPPLPSLISCVCVCVWVGVCACVCALVCGCILPQNKTQFDLLHWPVKLGCEAAPLFIPLMASLPRCCLPFPRQQLCALCKYTVNIHNERRREEATVMHRCKGRHRRGRNGVKERRIKMRQRSKTVFTEQEATSLRGWPWCWGVFNLGNISSLRLAKEAEVVAPAYQNRRTSTRNSPFSQLGYKQGLSIS